MDCPLIGEQNVEMLLDYAAGRLDKASSVRVERHMGECGACAAWLSDQTALWAALDDWKAEPVSADFNRRLWRQVDLLNARPWYRRLGEFMGLGSWKPAIPLAAAIAVIAAAFVMDHRGPAPVYSPAGISASVSEVDQVERSLDDVQLLRQFDSTVNGSAASKTM
jgi:anti-sigma factor RsiW